MIILTSQRVVNEIGISSALQNRILRGCTDLHAPSTIKLVNNSCFPFTKQLSQSNCPHVFTMNPPPPPQFSHEQDLLQTVAVLYIPAEDRIPHLQHMPVTEVPVMSYTPSYARAGMMPFPEVLLPYINMQLRQHAWNWVVSQ